MQIGEDYVIFRRYVPRYETRLVTVPGEVIRERVVWRVKRLTKRGRGRGGGGAKDLGVSRKTGSAASRRSRATRVGAKKGGIPQKEARKKKT
ncbi:hypothetical protein KKE06_04620 [Candidatus Micrarchaeota archaeon]|nr:hypothetical protein [Candidatus Micrarchaeota archaeon]MBU1930533.1 hypothetical protein [Candidatus Micrarchaeota archaeon]